MFTSSPSRCLCIYIFVIAVKNNIFHIICLHDWWERSVFCSTILHTRLRNKICWSGHLIVNMLADSGLLIQHTQSANSTNVQLCFSHLMSVSQTFTRLLTLFLVSTSSRGKYLSPQISLSFTVFTCHLLTLSVCH